MQQLAKTTRRPFKSYISHYYKHSELTYTYVLFFGGSFIVYDLLLSFSTDGTCNFPSQAAVKNSLWNIQKGYTVPHNVGKAFWFQFSVEKTRNLYGKAFYYFNIVYSCVGRVFLDLQRRVGWWRQHRVCPPFFSC